MGSKVKVTVNLPGEQPIFCDAEVVNIPDQKKFGMGLQFSNMADSDRARLMAFTEGVDKK